jgi:hypothetical protein
MMKTYMPIIFEMQQKSVQEIKKNEQLVTIYVLIYFFISLHKFLLYL